MVNRAKKLQPNQRNISNELIRLFFSAADMQRWNDKIRSVELTELDKQAHKMIIAYVLGKLEPCGDDDWIDIINGGIFEFLQRIAVTDIKSPIFYQIQKKPGHYKLLNKWAFEQIEPAISSLNSNFSYMYKKYFASNKDSLAKKILRTAHYYASAWEFKIIERADPHGFEVEEIRDNFEDNRWKRDFGLKSARKLFSNSKIKKFADLCGLLRFQTRWSFLYRIPKTSVLGHMLLVAILSYLFSDIAGACWKRCINNFFGGLFHDLPEMLTRDIRSPLKRDAGLDKLIKQYEKRAMNRVIKPLLPKKMYEELLCYCENEFDSYIYKGGRKISRSSADISVEFNDDRYNPHDGEFIEVADKFCAFVEAYLAIENGIHSTHLFEACDSYRNQYGKMKIADIDVGAIYAQFPPLPSQSKYKPREQSLLKGTG